jgi:hypothetical protein
MRLAESRRRRRVASPRHSARFFPHRASAALRASAVRSSGERFFLLLSPPFRPITAGSISLRLFFAIRLSIAQALCTDKFILFYAQLLCIDKMHSSCA